MLMLMLVILNSYFNSIKVRLEHANANASYLKQLFQFHKGAIRTREIQRKQAYCRFQFHKGAIRTIEFNTNLSGIFLFQFHKGAIRTCNQKMVRYDIIISIP